MDHARAIELIAQIQSQMTQALCRDQYRLQHQLNQLKQEQRQGKSIEFKLNQLVERLLASVNHCQQRQQQPPTTHYPPELPISQERERIQAAIAQNQVVIVAGETGSGKTTQLPKICLDAGRGIQGLIGCTQPRRIAARSIAARLAMELNTDVGQAVGYKVRFSDQVSERSYIKIMTDGILLAETQHDRFLNQYDTLIIDEAHERSLNIDFLLGYLKQLLPKRADLKIIITSATIDTQRFAQHFAHAPIIEVMGRTYPVELRYRPLDSQDDIQQAILAAVDEAEQYHRHGNILLFLAGERDIRETTESLRKHHPKGMEILPLYARLSAKEQNKVFQTDGQRRIILATNVAETSLTVPNIRTVIDVGTARISRYSIHSQIQRLLIEPISQASANQRKGRCGRVGAGLCLRLYDETDFAQRPAFTDPEILRTSLAAVILQMLALRLGDPRQFPFLEKPENKHFTAGFKLLEELGAVDKQQQLTAIGHELAWLPVDPRMGRMVLAAHHYGCLRELLIIVSALSIPDPRERPLDKQQAADEAHALFVDERSDFLSFLKLWDFLHDHARHLSQNKLRKLCQQRFLSYLRFREWHDIHSQLLTFVKQHGWSMNAEAATYEQIHCALLTGLLSHIAQKTDKLYLGARNKKLNIFPASGLFKAQPAWIVAAEWAETTKVYARCVAKIDPAWLESLAGDLCRYSHHQPHWEKRSAQVRAYEQVTLYGLPIVVKRKVNYAKINPVEAREIFIMGALVNADYHSSAAFFRHNQQLLKEINDLEQKARRPDIRVDDVVLYQFYDAQLPPNIHSGATFEHWLKSQPPKTLFLKREDLMQSNSSQVTAEAFPATLSINGGALALHYRHEPNHPQDGVTVDVPLALINQIKPQRFEWLVAGLLPEKITCLIKSLPKVLRKNFIPAPDFAALAAHDLSPSEDSLTSALSHYLQRLSGIEIPLDAWQMAKLPPHLWMNIHIINEKKQSLAMGRDWPQLKQQCQQQAQQTFATLPKPWEKSHLTQWDFGDLPKWLELSHDQLSVKAYPALVDNGADVALRLFDNEPAAQVAHRQGLYRLFCLSLTASIKNLQCQLPIDQSVCLSYAAIDRCEQLKQDVVQAVIEQVFLLAPLPRTQAQFEQRLSQGKNQMTAQGNELIRLLTTVLKQYRQIQALLAQTPSKAIETHRASLIYPHFLIQETKPFLQQYPRYFNGIIKRLQRLQTAPDKDREKSQTMTPLWQHYLRLRQQKTAVDWAAFKQDLEELRISLFAQELKTAYPVSVQRLEKKWMP